jgi:hypothetical protein
MSILSALTKHLLDHAGLSALVGTRIYPDTIPASTSETPNQLPLIVYKLLDEPVIPTHDHQNLYTARVQLDAWGGSYKSKHAVADQIMAAIDGYKGAMGDGSVYVGGCFRKGKRDNDNENVGLFRVEQIFAINYNEMA